jgi:hypothetical protein
VFYALLVTPNSYYSPSPPHYHGLDYLHHISIRLQVKQFSSSPSLISLSQLRSTSSICVWCEVLAAPNSSSITLFWDVKPFQERCHSFGGTFCLDLKFTEVATRKWLNISSRTLKLPNYTVSYIGIPK